MAIIAGVAARNVGWVLACCDVAIVTGVASTDYLGMVDDEYWRPKIHTMAIFANVGCFNMRRVLAGRIGAIVATRAVAKNIDVVKIRRQPGHGRVAVVASVAAGEVCSVFSGGGNAVMARTAAAEHLRVINDIGRQPGNRVMAILADVR